MSGEYIIFGLLSFYYILVRLIGDRLPYEEEEESTLTIYPLDIGYMWIGFHALRGMI